MYSLYYQKALGSAQSYEKCTFFQVVQLQKFV